MIKQAQEFKLTTLSEISLLNLETSSGIGGDTISTNSSETSNLIMYSKYTEQEILERLMDSLPEEIKEQIWKEVLSIPSKSLQLKIMLTSKKHYKFIIPKIYKKVKLDKYNIKKYFYGIEGKKPPKSSSNGEINWPISGAGIIPLNQIGLSYEPNILKISSFIRKFTLSNLIENLIINDFKTFIILLKQISINEIYKFKMNTWYYRVLFDQIDSITFENNFFLNLNKHLNENKLFFIGILNQIWNLIKSDCIILKFPLNKILKEETYKISINILGSPNSFGQENRLLDEIIINTPILDGIDLNTISCNKVNIFLNENNEWIGCDEKNHPECLSQEAQLRRFLKRHWLIGIDNNEYIGIPQAVQSVTIHNVASYNRRRCLMGRLSIHPEDTQGEYRIPRNEDEEGSLTLPTVLYSAMEGDDELAWEVNTKVHLKGIEGKSA
ncbi:uncharacterized protein I206_102157 [Kwoniella pini CBS 10737]|uniref:Uncharacterized protein n=1 Tax=Kwoniella pini CBS 10737 TaxID=1296096 RepID=A0A1B9HUM6_9TREE|nr:uncharacterized protein I206_06749 [Kwoniella pini CBS 10737]OCF46975.1 hypothetical protein I206_06749 [Kwoniella pini CBS 10737]